MSLDQGDTTTNGILSLTHIARLKCINNAHLINDIGTTPYHLIEPVLMKKTAKSLKQMESQSPQIIKDSEELWKNLLRRDFPDRPISQLDSTSRNLYDKYSMERDDQRRNAVGNLKMITKKLNDMKNKNKVKSINKVLPPVKKSRSIGSATITTPTTQVFKSSLLQKARVANKQRVRNFIQPKTTMNQISKPKPKPKPNFIQPSNTWVRLGQKINNTPVRQIPTPTRPISSAPVKSTIKRSIDKPTEPINKERLKRSKAYIHSL